MKIGMTLTLDGLIRALRWQGLAMTETKPAAERQSGFALVDEPARAAVETMKTKRATNGV